jgi:hypothetical protein
VISFAPTEGAATFDAVEGRILVWFPAPGIAACKVIGYATGDQARRAYELVDEQPSVPPEGFLDMYETTGFDWEARGRALKWNLVHLNAKTMFHILVKTPPLLMATTVFRRALAGHVEIHTDPASFASAYSLAVKRRSRANSASIPPGR